MNRSYTILVMATSVVLVTACSSTPERIAELDAARDIVAKVEASPRAGLAAKHVSDARKALDRANALATNGGDPEQIRFEAELAAINAQIADANIDTAQAREAVEKGTAERQRILLEARLRETELAKQESQRMQQQLAELQAKQTDRGMVLTLGDVLFDTGTATLKPGAYPTIDRLAQVMNASRHRRVTIEGHTDSTGSEETNLALSIQRALAVQSALEQRGVSASQITSIGKGESTPVAGNDTAGGRQQNRRVEIVFAHEAGRVASE